MTGAQQTPTAPEVGDVVRVRGQQWQVLHVQTASTPSGPHHGLALCPLEPGQSGEILGVVWQTETEAQILTPHIEPGPEAPTGTTADPAHLAAAYTYTWVPTRDEQDAIDWARAHAAEHLPGPSPREALDLVHELDQLAMDEADELAAEHAPDHPDLTDIADLGL